MAPKKKKASLPMALSAAKAKGTILERAMRELAKAEAFAAKKRGRDSEAEFFDDVRPGMAEIFEKQALALSMLYRGMLPDFKGQWPPREEIENNRIRAAVMRAMAFGKKQRTVALRLFLADTPAEREAATLELYADAGHRAAGKGDADAPGGRKADKAMRSKAKTTYLYERARGASKKEADIEAAKASGFVHGYVSAIRRSEGWEE